MTFAGADTTFFCPGDGANVVAAANGAISQTFDITQGSAVVPTSATTVGTVYAGSIISFSFSITSPTFHVVNSSAAVTTSATTVGIIYPGALITFSSQGTQYTVLSVTATTITLTSAYTGTSTTAATATVATPNYGVRAVSATAITLGSAVVELTGTGTTGATAAGADLTVLFGGQKFARRLTVRTAGTVVVNMIGQQANSVGGNLVSLYIAAGGHQDGCFTFIDSSSTAAGIAAFQ